MSQRLPLLLLVLVCAVSASAGSKGGGSGQTNTGGSGQNNNGGGSQGGGGGSLSRGGNLDGTPYNPSTAGGGGASPMFIPPSQTKGQVPTLPGYTPDVGGFRSTRPAVVASSQPVVPDYQPEGPPRAATLDDARENIPMLVDTYVSRRSDAGLFALDDALKGGTISVRYDGVDARSIEALGGGRFSAAVKFHDVAGRPVQAFAEVDLSGNEWKVLRLARGRKAKAPDAKRCFDSAVRAHVKARSRSGAFVFHDPDEDRDWRLRLKRVHDERLASFGSSGWFSCVDFSEAGGRTLDLDFYVASSKGGCSVEQIVVHRVDGAARTIKPMPAGAH